MQVTAETINGIACTVIRRPFDAAAVRESLAMGVPVVADHARHGVVFIEPYENPMLYDYLNFCTFTKPVDSDDNYHGCSPRIDFHYTLTILPALPRHPKPEDAALLLRYQAEGIFFKGRVVLEINGEHRYQCENTYVECRPYVDGFWIDTGSGGNGCFNLNGDYYVEITHAVDAQGNKIDIAITDRSEA